MTDKKSEGTIVDIVDTGFYENGYQSLINRQHAELTRLTDKLHEANDTNAILVQLVAGFKRTLSHVPLWIRQRAERRAKRKKK